MFIYIFYSHYSIVYIQKLIFNYTQVPPPLKNSICTNSLHIFVLGLLDAAVYEVCLQMQQDRHGRSQQVSIYTSMYISIYPSIYLYICISIYLPPSMRCAYKCNRYLSISTYLFFYLYFMTIYQSIRQIF